MEDLMVPMDNSEEFHRNLPILIKGLYSHGLMVTSDNFRKFTLSTFWVQRFILTTSGP